MGQSEWRLAEVAGALSLLGCLLSVVRALPDAVRFAAAGFGVGVGLFAVFALSCMASMMRTREPESRANDRSCKPARLPSATHSPNDRAERSA